MYRSSSSTRVSDEFFSNKSSSSSSSPPSQTFKTNTDTAADELPTYNPQSLVAKKERTRFRSSESAIHLIPLLLVLCAIILWFFSNPAVDLVNKSGDSIVASVKGLTNNDNASSSRKNGDLLLNLDQHISISNEDMEQEISGKASEKLF